MSWFDEIFGALIGVVHSTGWFGRSPSQRADASDESSTDAEQDGPDADGDGSNVMVNTDSVITAVAADKAIAECQRNHSHGSDDEFMACVQRSTAAILSNDRSKPEHR